MSWHENVRVGVLRGGPSSEYEVSLKTGAAVLAQLPEQYYPVDIFIDREGTWHFQGKAIEPHEAIGKVDVVWNALHGEYGEDGTVQHLLEAHGIPFTGSGRLASALSMAKNLAKKIVQRIGVKTAHHRLFRIGEISSLDALADELYKTLPQPSVIKPEGRGSSIGVSIARAPEEIAIALAHAFTFSDTVIVEEYIEGKEAVCGVIEGFREADFCALLPVEIILPEGKAHHDYETRRNGGGKHRSPGNFTAQEKEELQSLAIEIHRLLGLRHYSRSEFIVHPERGIFYLETDTLPDLSESNSAYIKSLESVGATLPQFLEHVTELALQGK